MLISALKIGMTLRHLSDVNYAKFNGSMINNQFKLHDERRRVE
jgi:hypothetical protein